MLYVIEVEEVYKAKVIIKADTQADAIIRLDAAQEDIREGRLVDHWLSRGFQGRKYSVTDEIEATEKNDCLWDFSATAPMEEKEEKSA